MELIHQLDDKFSIRNINSDDDVSAMIAGRRGGFLWFGKEPSSRYRGGFFEIECQLYKIIDDIRIKSAGPVTGITNGFWRIGRRGHGFAQNFFLDRQSDCFVHETGNIAEIEIYLDIRAIYANPAFNRHYRVWQENNTVLISYRQDSWFPAGEIFVAICGDISQVQVIAKWTPRDYRFDRERNSPPYEGWVFCPVILRASEITVAVAVTKEQAAAAAKRAWRCLKKTKKDQATRANDFSRHFAGLSKNQDGLAEYCAANALRMTAIKQNSAPGIRAGLPWFFQFWRRDEAVSLKALAGFDLRGATSILTWQLNELAGGRVGASQDDASGWIFLRASELIQQKKLPEKLINNVRECLQKEIKNLWENKTSDDLAQNSAGGTWMDSLDRRGACIEIQTLRLNMYCLAASLAKKTADRHYYQRLEASLKKTVRARFFQKDRLADRFDCDNKIADFTVRPNIFLAAYIYPELLSAREWITCFHRALPHLWLDWGGLSSLDKRNPRFIGKSTGENPVSYHNGDSWFWINNIAAIAMARVNYDHFKNYIEKIYQASMENILWQGAIGCASEISSADKFSAAGCPNQAWSNATFLELCQEKRLRK